MMFRPVIFSVSSNTIIAATIIQRPWRASLSGFFLANFLKWLPFTVCNSVLTTNMQHVSIAHCLWHTCIGDVRSARLHHTWLRYVILSSILLYISAIMPFSENERVGSFCFWHGNNDDAHIQKPHAPGLPAVVMCNVMYTYIVRLPMPHSVTEAVLYTGWQWRHSYCRHIECIGCCSNNYCRMLCFEYIYRVAKNWHTFLYALTSYALPS